MKQQRVVELDVLRGWAIILMMIFHLTYDLNYFHFISLNLHTHPFWSHFRYVIVTLFLWSVGVSLALVHSPKIEWNKMLKRTLILGGFSLIITVTTYVVFPHSWVYFGILHFILMASWVGLLFLPYPKITLSVASLILLGSAMGWLHTDALFVLLQKPLHLPSYTEDVLHPFPWFAVVLIGISATQYKLHIKLLKNRLLSTTHTFNTLLAFLGRYALWVYLIHLPLLFGLIMLLQKI